MEIKSGIINSRLNSYSLKPHFYVQFRTNLDKEKKQHEKKVKIIKKYITVAKRRQKEEIVSKIPFLKHREDNIKYTKKEKAIHKKALMYKSKIKKFELIKICRGIQKKKVIIINGIKQSSAKVKIERANKYKLIKEEFGDKLNKIRQKNNSNVKCLIKKIRVLRAFNNNKGKKRKIVRTKKHNEINVKEGEKNVEIINYLIKQTRRLQNGEMNKP